MSATSSIEWLARPDGGKGKSWNPVRGCSRVSDGCTNCYAMRQAHRFAGTGKPYEGLTTIRKGKVDWSGVARFIPGELDTPLRWKKPERVFVNSMSDLFHHSLHVEEIAAVFGVMSAAPRHQFLVLTKRPERMLAFFEWLARDLRFSHDPPEPVACGIYAANRGADVDYLGLPATWPLPNVWLGVSVENQETADERIPLLLKCPAAVRWISAEPLLGPIELGRYLPEIGLYGPALSWVVVGGESGPGARPFEVAWARSLVRLCRAASVSVFVKQLGSNVRDRNDAGFDGEEGDAWDIEGDLDRLEHDVDGYREEYQGAPVRIHLKARKGGDMSEWPADLRVREFPTVSA